jgi:predicted KAP-like P-loop ATPase
MLRFCGEHKPVTEAGKPHNDKPISEPAEDRFGIDPFARTLAVSIRALKAPEGTVIALNGPWGSGKSSAVNLILHHLKDAVAANEIVVINFACWWFRGEEALALAFFRELYAGLGPSLGDRFKHALPKLGARLLRAGSVVGAGADLAGVTAGVGSLAGSTMKWLSDQIHADDTVEKLHAELTKVLAEQSKRFLIVIDDIDRLAPDEALLMFRLVKSIGRLPNVIYLLVFDRQLAESIVSERYPSEGPHYLEKIIQAGFDIPEPRQADLNEELLHQIGTICGTPPTEDMVRFMNVFYDVIGPEMRTPRDLIRLTNALAVTWPAVGNEVDRADFVGMETLRLLRPEIYRALRWRKELLCGTGESYGRRERNRGAEMDHALFGASEPKDRERLHRALKRLFPRLESVWGNMHYGQDSATEWARMRRVCSVDHFDAYFRFAVDENVLSRSAIDAMIARASDVEFVRAKLRQGLATKRKNGKTKAALLLDELNLHADRVMEGDVEPLLTAIFGIADELHVDSDQAGPFNIGDNHLRIHWLLRRLTGERFNLPRRSAVFMAACEAAQLGWLVDFTDSAYSDYHPREGKSPEPEENCLTTAADADVLRAKALERLRSAAASGELAAAKNLAYLLFRWRAFAGDDGAEVKAWVNTQIDNDAMVAIFAKAFTSHGWSHSFGGLGDAVAKRTTDANVELFDKILDRDELRVRVEAVVAAGVLPPGEMEAVQEFLEAWRKRDRGSRSRRGRGPSCDR